MFEDRYQLYTVKKRAVIAKWPLFDILTIPYSIFDLIINVREYHVKTEN
jgi:hypothetical protein